MATSRPIRPSQRQLLESVGRGDVTWRADIGGRVSWRLWSSETDYVTVTAPMKRLEQAGLVNAWHGWQFGRGGVELTPLGKAALRPDSGSSSAPAATASDGQENY